MAESSDRPNSATPASNNASSSSAQTSRPKVQQPTPQVLVSRGGHTSILVSPRQRGNPILNSVKKVSWEYSDIAADYVLGATTCALFLSLKYHRLHPEYIYNRIRDLKGQYNLRILLTMVDIDNHEESLRELSKTSIINNVTVMLCWSAQEAGRYLELFKQYEHIGPGGIRAQQSQSYSDSLVEFITTPRSINKTDALGLVSNFGSLRTAINAGPDEVALIAGWGEKKVQRWCNSVREPFRIQKTAKRGLDREDTQATMSGEASRAQGETISEFRPDTQVAARLGIGDPIPTEAEVPRPKPVVVATADADPDKRPGERIAEELPQWMPGEDEEEAFREIEGGSKTPKKSSESVQKPGKRKADGEDMSEGIMAALNRLREEK